MSKVSNVLLILDGYGLGKEDSSNAIHLANTPNLDALFSSCPNTTLGASGLDVGLPNGQIGNSEVGHTNIGAGRVVFQDLPRISHAISDGSFFQNPCYISAMKHATDHGKALHVIGLLSDGGVHSHIDHFFALLEMAKQFGLTKIYFHVLLDGRDVPPRSATGYVKALKDKCCSLGLGKIATLQGRFYGMDRDKRWDRLQKGYDAIVRGNGIHCNDPILAVQNSYDAGVADEFVEPVVCDPEGCIHEDDSVVFLNFRPDRARELTWALTGNLPDGTGMSTDILNLYFVCTSRYDEKLALPIAFPPESFRNTFGAYVSSLGLTQIRIAETEKYAHVTFFFNGGVEQAYPGEDRVLIPSPKDFPTYDLIPEMSAHLVTEECVKRILSGRYNVVICNLANCDMVGHTGIMKAAIKAVETVDTCVGKILAAVHEVGGLAMITADHGNADCMIAPDGQPHTAHTTNSVPLIVSGANVTLRPGRLADIAPTMLDLIGYQKPEEMTGESLIIR